MNPPTMNKIRYPLFFIAGLLFGFFGIRAYLSVPENLNSLLDTVVVNTPISPEVSLVPEDDFKSQEILSDKGIVLFVDSPQFGGIISSPLEITGQAPGTWFFEASFPLILTDWDGKIIAQGYAQAQQDWMTESFVLFRGILDFSVPDYGKNGFLILQKDNPSGLPEYDDAVEIPIRFVE